MWHQLSRLYLKQQLSGTTTFGRDHELRSWLCGFATQCLSLIEAHCHELRSWLKQWLPVTEGHTTTEGRGRQAEWQPLHNHELTVRRSLTLVVK